MTHRTFRACLLSASAAVCAATPAYAEPGARALQSPTIGEFVVNDHSLAIDAVSQHAATRDGQTDGVFDATVTGDVIGFVLLTVNQSGVPAGGSQWDTIKVPASIGAPHTFETWVIGVEEHGEMRTLPDGRLPPFSGAHRLKLYMSNNGWFRHGSFFRLYVIGANGDVVPSAILAY
jgi:hypothetical protein